MKLYKLDDMVKGWFVGNFIPTAFSTELCEVSIKKYKKEDHEERHMHKVGTEITVVTRGRVLMNKKEYGEGDILVIEPMETTDFKALTDTETVVVKVPSVKGDKYIINDED